MVIEIVPDGTPLSDGTVAPAEPVPVPPSSVSAPEPSPAPLTAPMTWRESPDPDGPVARPAHYSEGRSHEPIDVIEDWGLGFHLGNAVKYIARCGRKEGEDPSECLRKAVWYLEREIARRERR